MNRFIRNLVVICLVSFLSACGGGGSDNSDSAGESQNDNSETTTRTFIVKLEDVEIRRISNDDRVEVDTSEIQSDPLTYQ